MQRETNIRYLESVESTNTDAADHLDSLADGTLIVAETQSSGHGRLGRKWHSPRGNIYASFVMKDLFGEPFHATMVSSLAVLSVLNDLVPGHGAYIKWPNDIYSREGRKIAGMLAELELSGNSAFAVFGIGINADFSKLSDGELPEEIRGSAGDLFSLSITRPELADIAVASIGGVLKAPEYLGKVGESFAEVDWLLGRSVEVCVGNEAFCGTARGVDARGRLRVELADGKERLVCGGEATLKKNWRAGL